MAKLFSGIQPTGAIHIGNYLGAIKNWVALQAKHDSMFCVVNYHAMTVPYDAEKLPQMTLDLAMDLLACGIDPRKSILFIQSDVPEHTELTWILNTITPIGELKRMTQFKDKSTQYPDAINMGLFDYPVLMAADILLYKSEVVPVGEDQVQHLELSREVARRFNNTFCQIFPEPKPLLTPAARIMSLTDPTKKMSKSAGPASYIALNDPPEIIAKKLATAVTDEARKKRADPGTPEKCNIYSLHQYFSSPAEIKKIAEDCRTASIGCLGCKKILANNIIKELAPIQVKRKELAKNPDQIKKILAQGAERARAIAQKNMAEIKTKTGLLL